MANIDEIIKEILADARHSADENLAKANAEAEEIKKAAAAACNKIKAEIAAETEAAKKTAKERAESAAAQKKRQTILKAKQDLIAQLLEKAYDSIVFMDNDDYFKLIETLLGKYSLSKDGEIYFSEKDLNRLPDGFETRIAEIAKKNGGTLTLSREPRKLDGGFILCYGGIEENCSLEAMFHEQKETLADKVHEFLFS